MFSGALLGLLEEGDSEFEGHFTLEQLGERVREAISERYPEEAVRPEVVSPDQREGDIADVPLFPNIALRPRQLQERLTVVEKNVDTLLRKLSDIDKSLGVLTSVQRKIAESASQRGHVGKRVWQA